MEGQDLQRWAPGGTVLGTSFKQAWKTVLLQNVFKTFQKISLLIPETL